MLLGQPAGQADVGTDYVFYRSEAQQPETGTTYPCGVMSEQLNTHKMPKTTSVAAAEGKALLYVMVEYGGIYQNRIGMDGRWVGATKGRGHIAVELDPGEHRLCAKLRTMDPAFTKLKAEAGHTYYLRVWLVTRSAFGRIAFETLDDPVAKKDLPGSTLYRTSLKQ
jgi:hypothetical protein